MVSTRYSFLETEAPLRVLLIQPFYKARDLNGRYCRGEVPSLQLVAAFLPKEAALGLCLYTFGNDHHSKTLRERDHRTRHLGVPFVLNYAIDKAAIQLQASDGKCAKLSKRRVPDAEVVQGQANATGRCIREQPARMFAAAHRRTLCDLQLEHVSRHLPAFQTL